MFRRDNIALAFASSALLVAIFYIVTLVAKISFLSATVFCFLASLAQALNFINLSHLRISQTYKVAAIGQFCFPHSTFYSLSLF
ncbi:hypothetical protein M8494_17370 [Serratia ureilytica]